MIEPEVYRELVGTSIRGSYHRYAHEKLEVGLFDEHFDFVLEVGGGVGEHLRFVSHTSRYYFLTDIQEPKQEICTGNRNVIFEVADVENLVYRPEKFNRVVVTCLLHHLPNPLDALSEIRRVTKPGGVVSILLPCDPGIVFRFLRRITADRFLRKQGLIGVKFFRAIEHRNHYASLLEMIRQTFKDDEVSLKSYPIDRLSWNLALFSVIQIRIKAAKTL